MNNDISLYSQLSFILTYRIGINATYFRQEMTLNVDGPDPTSSIGKFHFNIKT
jgi:hypothetical protein